MPLSFLAVKPNQLAPFAALLYLLKYLEWTWELCYETERVYYVIRHFLKLEGQSTECLSGYLSDAYVITRWKLLWKCWLSQSYSPKDFLFQLNKCFWYFTTCRQIESLRKLRKPSRAHHILIVRKMVTFPKLFAQRFAISVEQIFLSVYYVVGTLNLCVNLENSVEAIT